MDPQKIIVYRSQTDMFWDEAIANGDAVVYGFWIVVCCLAVVGCVVGYAKIRELASRRRPPSSRRYRGERWYES